jgi:hypothetical protein
LTKGSYALLNPKVNPENLDNFLYWFTDGRVYVKGQSISPGYILILLDFATLEYEKYCKINVMHNILI